MAGTTPTSRILSLYESAKIQKIEEAAIVMERNGFMIDPEYCAAGLKVALSDEQDCLAMLRQTLGSLGVPPLPGVDDIWSSQKQLPFLLEHVLKMPPSPYKSKGKVDLASGKRSTDKRALDWIRGRVSGDPAKRRIVEGVVELRRIRSGTKYLEKLPRFIGPDGFIHPVCGPAGDEDDRVGALTGRFGMKNPEGQQIPKDLKKDRYRIRRAFIAPPGMKLVVADYTALEVVILANISEMLFGDTLLLDLTAPGQDIHAFNAHGIFGKQLDWRTDSGRRIVDYPEQSLYKSDPELAWYRDTVKAVWYKLQYGGTIHGFATSLLDRNGEPVGEARAKEIVEALYAACPPIQKWHDWVAGFLRSHRGIAGLDGRWIDYGDLIDRGQWGFEAACRGADNGPMQMTGAATIGAAMVSCNEDPEFDKMGAKLQLQVHDELQYRAPEDKAQACGELLEDHMVNAFPLKNLRVEWSIGDNWENCKASK
jgi:DNA polymerase I-like protein with 3'-5' exonuclease and polymerase domains